MSDRFVKRRCGDLDRVRYAFDVLDCRAQLERSPDTGKVIWWKAPVELTSQHWSNVNRDSSFSSNFPTNEQRLLLMLSVGPSASFLLLYVADLGQRDGACQSFLASR
jgi:hypothetical protein